MFLGQSLTINLLWLSLISFLDCVWIILKSNE
jgi:hypothetical protein